MQKFLYHSKVVDIRSCNGSDIHVPKSSRIARRNARSDRRHARPAGVGGQRSDVRQAAKARRWAGGLREISMHTPRAVRRPPQVRQKRVSALHLQRNGPGRRSRTRHATGTRAPRRPRSSATATTALRHRLLRGIRRLVVGDRLGWRPRSLYRPSPISGSFAPLHRPMSKFAFPSKKYLRL